MRFQRTARLAAVLASCGAAAHACAGPTGLLFRDDFRSLDPHAWIVEAEPARAGAKANNDAKADAPVYVDRHRLVLDSARGLTVWLNRRLTGHYEIDYTRTVIDGRGPHERVSDMNQFWLARPLPGAAARTPFGRSGRFADYDSLDLFYAGIGGNDNTTTRFRHYDGSMRRPMLADYTAASWLLRGNHRYRIRIVVDGRGTRFYLDGRPCFAAALDAPGDGYFAFRTTASRQTVSDFSIRRLP